MGDADEVDGVPHNAVLNGVGNRGKENMFRILVMSEAVEVEGSGGVVRGDEGAPEQGQG